MNGALHGHSVFFLLRQFGNNKTAKCLLTTKIIKYENPMIRSLCKLKTLDESCGCNRE